MAQSNLVNRNLSQYIQIYGLSQCGLCLGKMSLITAIDHDFGYR